MTVILPPGPFGAISADPPWAFRTFSGENMTPHRCAEDHYRTMSREDLLAMPVADVAAKDCALFLWVVDSHIDEGIELGRAWGFTFKTLVFVWDKGDRMGFGYWSRKQAEVVLLFTRGKPRRLSSAVRQIIRAPRREHSRKPDEIYSRIEQLVAGPYLELFARQQWPGWSAWGNQVGKFEAPPQSGAVQALAPVKAVPPACAGDGA